MDRLSYHLDTDITISLRLQSDRDISLEGIYTVCHLLLQEMGSTHLTVQSELWYILTRFQVTFQLLCRANQSLTVKEAPKHSCEFQKQGEKKSCEHVRPSLNSWLLPKWSKCGLIDYFKALSGTLSIWPPVCLPFDLSRHPTFEERAKAEKSNTQALTDSRRLCMRGWCKWYNLDWTIQSTEGTTGPHLQAVFYSSATQLLVIT